MFRRLNVTFETHDENELTKEISTNFEKLENQIPLVNLKKYLYHPLIIIRTLRKKFIVTMIVTKEIKF